MWLTWLKTAAAGLLAFAAAVGLAAVLHDRPYVYPVDLRCKWLTVYVRASPRHVALGGWRTGQHDLYGTQQPYAEAAGVGVYTDTVGQGDERRDTDAGFSTAKHSGRLGQFGLAHGFASPAVPSRTELIVPTWLLVTAGVVPFAVVMVGRLRREGRAVQGHCRTCGYDLRATPGRCPECGTMPAADAVTA